MTDITYTFKEMHGMIPITVRINRAGYQEYTIVVDVMYASIWKMEQAVKYLKEDLWREIWNVLLRHFDIPNDEARAQGVKIHQELLTFLREKGCKI